jgi:tetratricopeptide (TPR) repeat protein
VSCKRIVFPLAISALAFLPACRRQPLRPAVERIAILRFENLGADPSLDWMGRAFSDIVTTELAGAPGIYAIPAIRVHTVAAAMGPRPAVAPGISAERAAALGMGATEVVFGQYAVRGGTLEARMTVEDELTGKMTALNPVSASAEDIVSLGSDLARQLTPHTVPYGTKNPLVVEAHVKAFEHFSAPELPEDLEKAIGADPNFGPTYRELAQIKIQQKDRAGAEDVFGRGLASGIPSAERALIQLEKANLRNDPKARREALTALSTAAPYDPEVWHDLGAAAMATHRYSEALAAYRKAVAIQPNDINFWNQLGYAAAYSGDAAVATDAIEHYRILQPDSPNPLDTLGDVNLILGRLSQAEQIYSQNAQKYPDFYAGLDFLKAAMAHLMTGDVAGADRLAQKYFDARATAKDAVLEFRKAQWAWISGRRKFARQQMEQLVRAPDTGPGRTVAVHAYAELAIWTLMLGDREAASELARKGAELTKFSGQATLARFLSQPPASAAEWQARAKTLVPDPAQAAIGQVALADALLIAKEFSAALPGLQEMYDSGNPTADEGLPVLLAWANVETGHIPEAAELLHSNPPLADVGLTWSTSLYFPRIFYLRAVVAEKQGKPDVARENWRIFHTLSGPDPLMWGEEQKGN